MKKQKNPAYDASSISVLKGAEAVRKRPGMYCGNVDEPNEGLVHILWEAIDNAVDEHQAGCCAKIDVSLNKDGSVTVLDAGRGIPVDIHKDTGLPAATVVMTELHSGGKFDDKSYNYSGGLHGVGISVTCFLSSWLELEIYRNNKIYNQRFETGVPVTKLTSRKDTEKKPRTGTKITFLPDRLIFKDIKFDYNTIAHRLKELTYLNAGLKISLEDNRETRGSKKSGQKKEIFCFKEGIKAFVKELNEKHEAINERPLVIQVTRDEVVVDACLQWCDDVYDDKIYAYTNSIRNQDGGTHVTALKNAVTRAINKKAEELGALKKLGNEQLSGDDVREGLTAIVAIKLRDPKFSSQTKDKLVSSEVRLPVENAISDALVNYLNENTQLAKRIIEKCLNSAMGRLAARKAKELVRRKSALDSTILPGKLADCSSKDSSECELYIVEGTSAGGSAKNGRDRATQAILPLRGKVINAEKADMGKIFANEEIKCIIAALGTGIHEKFDINKLRYHKIVIMCDADSDGNHIRALLLTFFFTHMRELIKAGHVYRANPPLYKLTQGKHTPRYAYSDSERDKILKEMREKNNHNIEVQRFKGLGEQNPVQLWETTLDPTKRTLTKITIDDEQKAEGMFKLLMGIDVPNRKKFIEDNALNVKNLDI